MPHPTMVKEHLQQAEHHVAVGERNIARQREIIQELKKDGHDTSEAQKLLEQFKSLQALHVQDRDRLFRELNESNASS